VYISSMPVTIVAAVASNNCIGTEGGFVGLPWDLPDDRKHFQDLTMGHPILMGRKTHEAIGRVLPGRTNIVISRNDTLEIPGCIVVYSFEEAVEKAREEDDEIFVVGGGQIYALALPWADRLELTRVHTDIEGDTFFPDLPPGWDVVFEEHHEADDRHRYPFTFQTLERST
jgi:dihydrofolate reductase